MPSPTTSSSGASPPESAPVIDDYRTEDDAAALALERLCAQGKGLRLSFRREAFRRRAEGFAVHRLFTARAGARLVGVAAVAVKPALLRGRPAHAAFGFDLRVDPVFRGRGLGRRLMDRALAWGMERADLAYTYTVEGNDPAFALAASRGAAAPGYAYLVLPTGLRRSAGRPVEPAPAGEVHAEMLAVEGPFDLLCDPFAEGRMRGHVASWRCGGGASRAGCSAWSNRGILGEVVVSLPAPVALLGRALRLPLLRRLPLPRIPSPGDELASWYLYDFFSTEDGAARHLLRGVAAEARERGVDWLYLPLPAGDRRLPALRGEAPRPFTRIVPYRMTIHEPGAPGPPIRKAYVDVRDL